MKKFIAAFVAAMGIVAIGVGVSGIIHSSNEWRIAQDFKFVCDQMEAAGIADCEGLVAPTVVTDRSIGAYLFDGQIYGTMGLFAFDTPDLVFIDPIMLLYSDKLDKTIIHEMVHYVDFAKNGENKDLCDAEEIAHDIASIWMIQHGDIDGFLAEAAWRTWYPCS